MRAGYFAQRRLLCAGDQNQARALRIGQGFDRVPVLGALLFKAGKGSEARGVALAFIQKTAPGARQLQQPDRVAGGRGVKNDVVVAGGQCPVGQQCSELVEGCYLGSTGTGELFFDAFDRRLRQNATHRANDAVTICLRRGLRIYLQRRQAGQPLEGR